MPFFVRIVHNEIDPRKLVAVDVCVENVAEEGVQWKRHFGEIRSLWIFYDLLLDIKIF
jgi:hypothetical protein